MMIIGTSLLQKLPTQKKRLAIFFDSRLSLPPLPGTLFPFQASEQNKTRATKEFFEDQLLSHGFDRTTLLIAIGGGVTLDLGGFLAATFLRGIPFISVPTTLLAMVDASIGGKTGVNTPLGKNLIGAFHTPEKVLIDLNFLTTLPPIEWLNGLAEILKMGLIANPTLWTLIEEHPTSWQKPPLLKRLIRLSIAAKQTIVAQDPLETKNRRRILNFGHTIGHALETVSNYTLPHGQAVALGTLAESFLSQRLGYLPEKTFERILSLYKKIGFALTLPKNFDKGPFLKALLHDKKNCGKGVRSVLIRRIGTPLYARGEYATEIALPLLDEVISWMRS